MGRAVRAKRTGAMVAVDEVGRERGGGPHLEREGGKEEVSVRDASLNGSVEEVGVSGERERRRWSPPEVWEGGADGVRRRRVRRKDVACGFDSGGGPHLLDHDAFGEAVVEQVAAELDVRGRRRPHAGVRVVVHLLWRDGATRV